MAMPILWPVPWSWRDWVGDRAARDHAARRATAPGCDPALRVLLDRRDDRLLRDVRLRRADLLGPAGLFWEAWSRRCRHPML